ncbi:MAG: hypothetical protein NTW29_19355 [Bacteroidetes bacterium]|nr:hypothetical protein [Bacteroidota bacterium]
MKKEAYINIYVMIASASHNAKKEKNRLADQELGCKNYPGCQQSCPQGKDCAKGIPAGDELFQLFA